MIQALENPPPPHPHDKPLLRPLSTLGKPNSATSGASFLRRTEYITAIQAGLRYESSTSKELVRPRNTVRKAQRSDANKDDPLFILRATIKGFDLAYPDDAYTGPDSSTAVRGADITPTEREAWANPVHPTRPVVTLLDSYPILPDLEGLPDTGSYVVMKFITNPVAASDRYDERLDVGLLRPMDQSIEAQRLLEAQMAEHANDPSRPPPMPQYDYEFFLPSLSSLSTLSHQPQTDEHQNDGAKRQDASANPVTQQVRALKRKLDLRTGSSLDESDNDGDENDPDTRQGPPKKVIRFDRLRAYESYQQTGDASDAYGDTVIIALHEDGDDDEENNGARIYGSTNGTLQSNITSSKLSQPLQKAAYYYPVVQRTFIRPKRTHGIAPNMAVPVRHTQASGGGNIEDDETKIDVIEAQIRDPTEKEVAERLARRVGIALGPEEGEGVGTNGEEGTAEEKDADGVGDSDREGIEEGRGDASRNENGNGNKEDNYTSNRAKSEADDEDDVASEG